MIIFFSLVMDKDPPPRPAPKLSLKPSKLCYTDGKTCPVFAGKGHKVGPQVQPIIIRANINIYKPLSTLQKAAMT